MSVDDQLLKPDGTVITAIDIAILKFARAVACVFLKKEDTGYSRAYRAIQWLVVALVVIAEVCICIESPAIIGFAVIVIAIWAYPAIKRPGRCVGIGTHVPRDFKIISLVALLALPAFFASMLVLYDGWFGRLFCIIFALACFLDILAVAYIARLGGRKLRKKKEAKAKAKVFKPAFSSAGV